MGLKKFVRAALCSFGILFIASCGQTDKNRKQLDSLENACEKYAMQLQTDTLSTAADKYFKKTTLYSKDYYRARHFQILADFNAHDYPKVLAEIDNTMPQPHFKSYADVACRYQYTRARAFQYSTRYDEAVRAFQTCLGYDSPNDSVRENIRVVTLDAMLQLLNTNLAAGRNVACSQYFLSLIHQPAPLIRKYCMRDLYSIAAYACFMADDNRKAFALMDKALVMPLYRSDDQRLFRDYSYATAIYNSDSKYQKQAIDNCQKALQVGYSDKNIVGLEWLTELLGSIYVQTGRIDKAVDTYRQSIRSFQQKANLKGEVDVNNRLVELYTNMHQYHQANIFADISVTKCQQLPDHDPALCGTAYLNKANVQVAKNKINSAFYYLKRAHQYFDLLPYGNGDVLVDIVSGGMYLKMHTIGAHQKALACLNRALPASTDVSIKANSYLELSKALIGDGRTSEGEVMLDSMYATLKSFSTPVYIPGAYQFALRHYLEKHDAAKAMRYAAEYLSESEHVFNGEVAKKTSLFAVKYNTEKKEQQLKIAQAELKNKELKSQIAVLIGVVLLIVVIGMVCFIVYKKRLYQLRQLVMQRRLAELTSDLNELRADVSNKQLRADASNRMTMEEGENNFRHSFFQRYPMFLSQLKAQAPDITHREELLCMLIALDQTTDQIAETFCIARKSVNMMRYRIRSKMCFGHDDSLENVLKSLLD